MKFWLPLLLILAMSAAASATTDISGYFGGNGNFYGGFTGRTPPLVGNVGNSGTAPPANCGTGVIDLSKGCAMPMLGGL